MQPQNPQHPIGDSAIQIYNTEMTFQVVEMLDRTPTGAQISAAAGFQDSKDIVVLQIQASGLKDISPNGTCNLADGAGFVVAKSDRLYLFELDRQRYEWPANKVSGQALRILGSVPADKLIYLDREGEADREIGDADVVNLGGSGTEVLHTAKRVWKLKVQDTILEFHTPTVVASDALEKAGIDIKKEWHIYLLVKGEPKREIPLDFIVDLTKPGIEKIRVTQKDVSNGEGVTPLRRAFKLLAVDHAFLDSLGLRWETVLEEKARWLLIHGYVVPDGYNCKVVTLALLIPIEYPGAQIDMFFTYPALMLASGRALDRVNQSATIDGKGFNGWSRHRGNLHPWNSETDNVRTHMALVEGCLCKEVEL